MNIIPRSLLKKWEVEQCFSIIETNFGVLCYLYSKKYGYCIAKKTKNIKDDVHSSEINSYLLLSKEFMCNMLDFSLNESIILLEYLPYQYNNYVSSAMILSMFNKIKKYNKIDIDKSQNNYFDLLLSNLKFLYDNIAFEKYIEQYLDAVRMYLSKFINCKLYFLHGDLTQSNIFIKGNKLVAIDPIGYIAPFCFEIARFIGTEIYFNPNVSQIKNWFNMFSSIESKNDLYYATLIDIKLRMINSLYEDTAEYNFEDWSKCCNDLISIKNQILK